MFTLDVLSIPGVGKFSPWATSDPQCDSVWPVVGLLAQPGLDLGGSLGCGICDQSHCPQVWRCHLAQPTLSPLAALRHTRSCSLQGRAAGQG